MKIYKLISIITLFSLFVGCSEDFLDQPDMVNITTENFWKSPKDFKLYVNQFYESFPGFKPGAFNGGIYWADDNSDQLVRREANIRLNGQNTIVASNRNWNFTKIRALNIMVEKYSAIGGDTDTDKFKQPVGEGLFFRAYFNFNLLRDYGAFPYNNNVLAPGDDELYVEKTPRSTIVNNIIADLDTAIVYMKSGPNHSGNRLNREIAMLFKARVALYEGTWEKYHAGTAFGVSGSNGTAFLNIAAIAATDLINSEKYKIHNTGKPEVDYYNLFGQTDLSANKEVMLWRKFDVSLGIAHNAQRYLASSGGGLGFTKSLIDDYLCADGKPIASSPLYLGDDDLVMVSTNRDSRLSATIWIPGQPFTIKDGRVISTFLLPVLDAVGNTACTTGYQIRKGSNPDRAQKHTSNVGTTTSPIFRYAEALLIFAEAKAELGTITQSDVDISINLLRARAGVADLDLGHIENDPNWQFPELSPIINEIRRERHVEMAGEGYRWDDIARWAAADELLVGKRPLGAIFNQADFPELIIGTHIDVNRAGYIDPLKIELPSGYGFAVTRDYLLPIPESEILLNPKIVQNPGW